MQNGTEYRYEYDSAGRLLRYYGGPTSSNGLPKIDIAHTYNDKGQLVKAVRNIQYTTRNDAFLYDTAGRLIREDIVYGDRLLTYDALGRLGSYQVYHTQNGVTTHLFNRQFVYYNSGNNETSRVEQDIVSGPSLQYNRGYNYDANNNITGITNNITGNTVTYGYDSMNQLTSAQDADNSYSYSYDNGGNITSKTINGVTTQYVYGDDDWGDMLTAYNGQSITYDTIGNPLAYRDGMSFTWNGRELSAATVNGQNISYSYNADGVRVKKTVGSTETYYAVDGGKVASQRVGGNSLYFDYSADGTPFEVAYNSTFYYYVLNIQGDVIAICDSAGNPVIEMMTFLALIRLYLSKEVYPLMSQPL